MPEIGEVARVVHYLKKHLINKRIASVQVQEDNIVYGKVGTTAAAFQASLTDKTALEARQQGKYFWLVMDSPPHPVMHLGMTGWVKFSKDDNSHYRPKKEEDAQWPPRFWKFILKTEDDDEVAFVDARRLARIRLIDGDGEDLRKMSPLKENGPDPVVDKDVLTLDWFTKKMRSKRVPAKALLLDQGNISGVGNWVADEILYQARIHPEQYSNTFSDEQLKTLHDKLLFVCTTACELLAESDKFPENWLMKYRWDKGKKGEVNKLPNGEKIVHLKVGGRTSAIVPSVQKKTAAVAGDVSTSELEDDDDDVKKPDGVAESAKSNGKKRKANGRGSEEPESAKRGRKTAAAVKAEVTEESKVESSSKKVKAGAKRKVKQEDDKVKMEEQAKTGSEDEDEAKEKATPKAKSKSTRAAPAKKEVIAGSRRSARLSG
ncbi:hypothetical protein AAFC00_005576 [Neodothiora populina]|uniref:Formamidopyrimidine-DNA glycosylase catalytic domain-containing protein n=1 Tax=Neodothiora populina TaxID=2781224 RepID=A0ABR3PLM0_9PEZI